LRTIKAVHREMHASEYLTNNNVKRNVWLSSDWTQRLIQKQ